jgi:hypothetical protein
MRVFRFAVPALVVLLSMPAARAVPLPLSDTLTVIFDGTITTRVLEEGVGESVTDEIAITIPKGDASDFKNNDVFLVSPGPEVVDIGGGLVNGFESDKITLHVSGGPGGVTVLHFTMNSDQDPGRNNKVDGLLETGAPQDITALLLAGSDVGTHTVQVFAFSDIDVEVPPIPEPATLLLLGFGGACSLLGLRRRKI